MQKNKENITIGKKGENIAIKIPKCPKNTLIYKIVSKI
jgi:hypothetical protein